MIIAICVILYFVAIAAVLGFFAVSRDKSDFDYNPCPKCDKPTLNNFRSCAAAEAEESARNVTMRIAGTSTRACDCCDHCRQKCLDAWWEEKHLNKAL